MAKVDLMAQLKAIKEKNAKEGILPNIADTLNDLKPSQAMPAIAQPQTIPVGKTNASVVDDILGGKEKHAVTNESGIAAKPKFNFGAKLSQENRLLGNEIKENKIDNVTKITQPEKIASVKAPIKTTDILTVEIDTFEKGSEGYTEEELQGFKGALKMLYENITDASIVGQSIKNVMYSLAETPEFKEMLKPEDIGMMVRGLRESYGMVIAKKSERKESSNVKQSKQKLVDDAFADIEF